MQKIKISVNKYNQKRERFVSWKAQNIVHTNLLSYDSGSLKIETSLNQRAKNKVLAGLHFFLVAPEINPFAHLFQCLEAASIPWFMAPLHSLNPAMVGHVLLFMAISPVFSLLPPSSIYKDPRDYTHLDNPG